MRWVCILQLRTIFLTTKNKISDNDSNKSSDNNCLDHKELGLIIQVVQS